MLIVAFRDRLFDGLGAIGGAIFAFMFVPFSFLAISAVFLMSRRRHRLELEVQQDRWAAFRVSVRQRYGDLAGFAIASIGFFAAMFIPMIVASRSLRRMVTGSGGGKVGWRFDGTIDFDAQEDETERTGPSDGRQRWDASEAEAAPPVEDQWHARWGGRPTQ